jgi:predicted nucleotidyltransferase
MSFGLPEPTIHKIFEVLSHYAQVDKAILYGSRAKGNFKNGSDIDLTLIGSEELTQTMLYKILDDLDDLLLQYTIDLSIYDDIGDPDVIEHIQRVGVTFYERGKSFSEVVTANECSKSVLNYSITILLNSGAKNPFSCQ